MHYLALKRDCMPDIVTIQDIPHKVNLKIERGKMLEVPDHQWAIVKVVIEQSLNGKYIEEVFPHGR